VNQILRFIRRAEIAARKRFGPEFKVQIQRPLQEHGTAYGGWTIDPAGVDSDSIVYSFGVGDDISFDLSLIETFGCHVFAFDPTPKSIAWIDKQVLPPHFHFHGYGIAAHDGEAVFSPPLNPEHISYSLLTRPETMDAAVKAPVYRLQTIMNCLGHSHIDILKMDIEGAEYDVIEQLVASTLEIRQLLVEFHHRFAAVGWQPTKTAVELLDQGGYKTFHISPSGEEFSFLRESS